MVILGKSFWLEITYFHFFRLLYGKFAGTFHRLRDIMRWLPLRARRIFTHISNGLSAFSLADKGIDLEKTDPRKIAFWWAEFFVLLLSFFGIAEIYETLTDFIKFNTRPLSGWERKLLFDIYGDSINYDRVRIDNLSFAGPRQYRFCYVSFYTVNSWGDMPNHILVHEMMHVWQYQRLGARYIPQALRAQHSALGYNYGGLSALQSAKDADTGLAAFNLEQQAEIITDYYLLRQGYKPRWSDAIRYDLPLYEYFVNELK